jgi:hypothetical protein
MRPPNADLRAREYLTEAEVERLLSRHGEQESSGSRSPAWARSTSF